MNNFWLAKRTRRKLRGYVLVCVGRELGSLPDDLNQSYIDKCAEHAAGLVESMGYLRAMQEIEGIIKTVASIDRDRFVRG